MARSCDRRQTSQALPGTPPRPRDARDDGDAHPRLHRLLDRPGSSRSRRRPAARRGRRPARSSAASSAARVPEPRSRMSSGSPRQLRQRDLRAPGPGMPGGHHHHLLVGHELAELEPAPRQPRPHHRHLDPALRHPVHHRPGCRRSAGWWRPRGTSRGTGPRRAGRMYSPGMVLPPTTRLAAHPALEASDRLARLAREGEHARRVREQQLAGPRDARPAPEPVEQPHAELVLEGADMLGHRGLGEMQRLGGAGEGGELGDLGEDLELTQIHGGRKYRRRAGACPAASAPRGLSRAGTPPPP